MWLEEAEGRRRQEEAIGSRAGQVALRVRSEQENQLVYDEASEAMFRQSLTSLLCLAQPGLVLVPLLTSPNKRPSIC